MARRPLSLDARQVQRRVQDLDVGCGLDVAGGDVLGAPLVEAQRDRLRARAAKDQVLDVQDEVGHVLLDPGDRVELVEGLVEAHLGDRGAGNRRQEGAAQAVAERVAEAGLEGRDDERL